MVKITKKVGLIIGGVVVVLLAVTITLAVVLTMKPTCETEVCKRTANLLKAAMDEKTDPCENFYQFACGNFLKKATVPRNKHFVGPFSDAIYKMDDDLKDILNNHNLSSKSGSVIDNAVRYFRSCKQSAVTSKEKNRQMLITLLTDLLNGTPLVPESMNKAIPQPDWRQSLAKILRYLDQNLFLDIKIFPDTEDPSKYAIVLQPETMELIGPSKDIMRSPQKTSPLKTESDDMKKVICLIDKNCTSNPNLSAYLHSVEYMLGFYYWNPPNHENWVIERMTIRNLQKSVPEVNWLQFFRTVFENTEYQVTLDTAVVTITESLKYVLNTFLGSRTPSEIAAFLGWKIISKWGTFLLDDVRAILEADLSVEDKCLQLTNDVLGFAVGNLYHSKLVTNETVNETTSIINDLKKSFKELVNENDWMDRKTKDYAIKKVENMVQSVSVPDWAKDESELNKHYGKIGSMNLDNFQQAFRNIQKFSMERNAALLTKQVDRKNDWPVESSAVTNAFYYPYANAMIFPSGILTVPFYETGRPSAINYGSFGYIAGHEITHGFDNTGRTFDERGGKTDWWTSASLTKFENKAMCFVRQYGVFDPDALLLLNGWQTLGENIADNGGVREAFRAFQNHQKIHKEEERLPGLTKYDQEQLFFISAGYTYCTKTTTEYLRYQIRTDSHAPNKYRVLMPLENSEGFAKAFGCKKKSRMVPAQRCIIW